MDVFTSLNEVELVELDNFLESPAVPHDCLNLNMLDGFLTALVSGPEIVLPSEWLPLVWGEDEQPEFESLDQASRIMELIFRHMNGIVSTLMYSHEEYSPFFMHHSEFCNEESGAEEWSLGYLTGMTIRIDQWAPLRKIKNDYMIAPMLILGTESGGVMLQESKDHVREREDLIKVLPLSVVGIHQYWLAKRTPPAPRGTSTNAGKRKASRTKKSGKRKK